MGVRKTFFAHLKTIFFDEKRGCPNTKGVRKHTVITAIYYNNKLTKLMKVNAIDLFSCVTMLQGEQLIMLLYSIYI